MNTKKTTQQNHNKEEETLTSFKELKKLHAQNYHISVEQMRKRYPNLLKDASTAQLDAVIDNCKICEQSQKRHKFFGHKMVFKNVNECVCVDVLFIKFQGVTHAVLHLVDGFSRWSLAVTKENDSASSDDVIRALDTWTSLFGASPSSIFTDNGTEFVNEHIY